MSILWRLRAGTVVEVLEKLPPDRKLAYTSVSTILRILEKKSVLDSRKQGRAHIYTPRISKQEYESWSVQDLVTRLFDGTPAQLVRRLLESEALSSDDLDSIRGLLQKKAAR